MPGVWCLVSGVWRLVPGAWCLMPGAWCLVLVSGAWCLMPDAWCLVPDLNLNGNIDYRPTVPWIYRTPQNIKNT
jgi:hypothetical protein